MPRTDGVTAYWVSTPNWTVVVVTDAGGMVRHTAPYLWRMALGQPWTNVRQMLAARYGPGLRVEHLRYQTKGDA